MKTATEPFTETPAGDVLLVAGHGEVRTFMLSKPEIVVGRDAGCDIVIDNDSLSRRHFSLRLGPPLTVQDLGSTNGTRVAGKTVRGGDPVEIATGASFHVSGLSFLVIPSSTDPSSQRSHRELLSVNDPTVGAATTTVVDVAKSGINVLILGESGTGKEVLAETLHVLSKRTGPLQRINCAALSEQLLESEMFGHEKGAFTGATNARPGLLEAAHGGTVLLDEIGELSLGIQAKLLRAIETREVTRLGASRPTPIDVRFICATHRELAQEVADKRFRHDLYFRIDGITLRIPPLRERRGLITRLATQFAQAANAASVSVEALAALEGYGWPGNVRELKAVIERAALLARGKPIGVNHLAFTPRRTPADQTPASAAPPPEPPIAPAGAPSSSAPASELTGLTAEQIAERARIIAALDECSHNQTRAAALLGMSRTSLVTKLRIYRIPRPRS